MDAGTVPYGYGGPTSPPRASTRLDLGAIIKDGWVLFAKDWVALVVGVLIVGALGMLTFGIPLAPLLLTGGLLSDDSDGLEAVGAGAILLAVFLSIVVMPVLAAGIYKMILRRVREGRPAEIGDVFSCFDRVGPLFVFTLIMVVIVVVLFSIALAPLLLTGGLLSGDSDGLEAIGVGAILLTVLLFFVVYAVIVYLSIIWFYVVQVIIDKGAGIGEALSQSRRLVMANGFWWHVLAMLVIGGIASVVTLPISVLNQITFGLASVLYAVVVPYQIACYMSMYFQVTGDRHLLPSALPGVPMAAYQGGGRVSSPQPWQAGPAMAYPYGGYGGQPAPWQPGAAMPSPYGAPPAPTAVGGWDLPPAGDSASVVPAPAPAPEDSPSAPPPPTPPTPPD